MLQDSRFTGQDDLLSYAEDENVGMKSAPIEGKACNNLDMDIEKGYEEDGAALESLPKKSTKQHTIVSTSLLDFTNDEAGSTRAVSRSSSVSQHTSNTGQLSTALFLRESSLLGRDSDLSSVPPSLRARSESITSEAVADQERTSDSHGQESPRPAQNPTPAFCHQLLPDPRQQTFFHRPLIDRRHDQRETARLPVLPYMSYDGLPRSICSNNPSIRGKGKAPVIVISDSEDEPQRQESNSWRFHQVSHPSQFRNVNHNNHHSIPSNCTSLEGAERGLDLEDDAYELENRKRARLSHERHSGSRRMSSKDGSRQKRHEREWEQKRRALIREQEILDRSRFEGHEKSLEVTLPPDFDLGQDEMQEFEGLLGNSRPYQRNAESSSSSGSPNSKSRSSNTTDPVPRTSPHGVNGVAIPSFVLDMDREQRAANRGRYNLEEAIAAFDREQSSHNDSTMSTPQSRQEEPIVEIMDDDDARNKQEDIQRRTQQYIDENEEFFRPSDEEVARRAIGGRKRVEECAANEKEAKMKIWQEVLEEVTQNRKSAISQRLEVTLTLAATPKEEKSYLKHEWPEPDHIRHYLKQRLSSLPVEVTKKCTLETLTARINELATRPPIPNRTISHSVIIKDINDEVLLVKVNTGIEEVFSTTERYKESGPMYKHILNAMDKLESHGVHPPKPRNSDARHSTDRHVIAKEYWATKNQPCGVFYFACWRPLGAYRGHFSSIAGPYGHVLSRDILGEGAWDFGIRARYLANMAPVHQAISLWFETIDKPRYEECRLLVDKLADADTGLEVVKYAQTQSFLALATLRNMQARNHKDRTNVTDGWAGMTCVGSFTGGELCLPDLDVNITFLPGDVIFFRSSLLEHFVRKYVGTRSSLIFFSQTDPKIPLTQNARFTEQGSKEWERIAAHRKAEIAEEERRKEKMKEFVGLEPYPTKESDLSPYKMQMARRRKLRFVRFATREAEKGEKGKVGWDEVRRLEGLDGARFYELNLVELNRWKRGCYPFKPLSEEERRKEKRRRERERERARRGE